MKLKRTTAESGAAFFNVLFGDHVHGQEFVKQYAQAMKKIKELGDVALW